MKIKNNLVKDLTVVLEDEASYPSLVIFINDKEAATFSYRDRDEEIESIEITSISKDVLEKISELLTDKKEELIEWIEQVW